MRMCKPAALLAIISVAATGCAKQEGFATAASSAAAPPATTTTTATGGTTAGGSSGQNVSSGATAFVFNESGTSTTGNGIAKVTIANDGGGTGVETATVEVNTGNTAMTWADPVEMKLFKTGISVFPATDNLGGNYKEYRTITADTDVELQVWSFNFSQISSYKVYSSPSAANDDNVALFYDGTETPVAALPGGAVTYNGKFGGIAEASNWLTPNRAVNDPFDTDAVAGSSWDPNGTWRVVGDVTVNADFGAGTVNGTLNNSTWRQFTGSATSPDGYITITPAEVSRPFGDYTFAGTITGNKYTGSVSGSANVVTGENAVNGGFFGPNGEETAGAFTVRTTNPDPTDGRSPNDSNRRGFIDLRGVFQGTR